MRARKECRRGEEGAALVLALVFILAVGLVMATLVGLTGTNLLATSGLQAARATQFGADGALEQGVQTIRYQTEATTTALCGNAPTAALLTTTINSQTVVVWCQSDAPVAGVRQVQFYACTSPNAGSVTDCSN